MYPAFPRLGAFARVSLPPGMPLSLPLPSSDILLVISDLIHMLPPEALTAFGLYGVAFPMSLLPEQTEPPSRCNPPVLGQGLATPLEEWGEVLLPATPLPPAPFNFPRWSSSFLRASKGLCLPARQTSPTWGIKLGHFGQR